MSAIPISKPHFLEKRVIFEGDVPSLPNPPGGCRFLTRCLEIISEICTENETELREINSCHCAACYLYG